MTGARQGAVNRGLRRFLRFGVAGPPRCGKYGTKRERVMPGHDDVGRYFFCPAPLSPKYLKNSLLGDNTNVVLFPGSAS